MSRYSVSASPPMPQPLAQRLFWLYALWNCTVGKSHWMTERDDVPSSHLLPVGCPIQICWRQIERPQNTAWAYIQQCISLISKCDWYCWCVSTRYDGLRWKRPDPVPGKRHQDRRRQGIEALIHISVVIDRISSEDDEIRICARRPNLAFDIARAELDPVQARQVVMPFCRALEL